MFITKYISDKSPIWDFEQFTKTVRYCCVELAHSQILVYIDILL